MALRSAKKRWLATFASPEAFAPRTIAILSKLGYGIVAGESLLESGKKTPDLWIVDERRLGEVPEIGDEPCAPVIVLTGRHGVTGADSRIVGAVQRPAGVHEFYRLLQQVFEEHPRATPRVPVHLRARCRRSEREWRGAMLSLSENGCLLRSSEALPLGSQVSLSFTLPGVGDVELWAESAYQLVPDTGLVFSALAAQDRDAIQSYVIGALTHA